MDDTNKGKPGGEPSGSALSPVRFDQMFADPETRRQISIRLSVGGGLPGRFEPFSVEVDGTGAVTFARTGEGRAEPSAQLSTRVGEDVVRHLLREVGAEDIAAAAERRVPIPPDSLVGLLEIQVGGSFDQVVFMADDEQAQTARFHLAEPLRRLVDDMVRIAEEASGSKGSLLGSSGSPRQGE